MAKSKWPEIKEKLVLVEGWARDGLSDEQMAKNLGISPSTYYEYQKKYAEFSESIKTRKEEADYEVVNKLFESTQGFVKTIKKSFKLKEISYDEQGRRVEKERLEQAEEEQYIPPSIPGIIYWLNNRMSEKWKNRQDFTTASEIVVETKLKGETGEWAK